MSASVPTDNSDIDNSSAVEYLTHTTGQRELKHGLLLGNVH